MKNYHECLNDLLNQIQPLQRYEYFNLYECLGKILFEDVICIKNLPAFNNSAMDGYVFKYEDKNNLLDIKDTILAGEEPIDLAKNECFKIMTGAKVPKNADSVVAFEDAILVENKLEIPKNIKKHNAFRFKGEEQKKGNILLKKGTKLKPAHVGLLASQGIFCVKCQKNLNIAIISTGNEIKEPWQKANKSQIYNINAISTSSLLLSFGFKSTYCGIVQDDEKKSFNFLKNLLNHDVIITSGGVSKGEADFIRHNFIKLGLKEIFSHVNIRPGRPTMAGFINKTLVVALPGNPIASFLNTFLFIIPALKKLNSDENYFHKKYKAKVKSLINFKQGRNNILVGKSENGLFEGTNKFGSAMMTPLINANAICISDEKKNSYEENEIIYYYKLNSFF